MQFSISKLVRSVCVLGLALPVVASAQVFNMEGGQSQVVQTKQKIDTIFVSSPDVADYEIIGDQRFIIYAKGEGFTEVTAFDSEGNELRNDTVNVNGMMKGVDRANQQIKSALPDSQLTVRRVGKGYVIEGKAKSELERQTVNRIVGAALGGSAEVLQRQIDRGDGSKERVPFLDEYRYQEVVDNSTTDSAVQINVRLSVVEVSKKLTQELGIKWNNLAGSVSSLVNKGLASTKRIIDPLNPKNLDGTPNIIEVPVSTVSQNIAFGAGDVAGAGGAIGFNVDNLNGFIHALNDDSKARVLAEPNISILSGEIGSILVGGEVPFVQRTANEGTSVEWKEFGIKLNVGAKLLKDDRIRLMLVQEVSNVVNNYGVVDGVPVPAFSSRKSQSTFELADGESFILGGLYSDNDSKAISKFPLLGDIPVIGSFFRSVEKLKDQRELVIVATVNTVKPTQKSDIVYPEYQETGLLEDFFAMPNLYHKTLTNNFFKRAGFSQ